MNPRAASRDAGNRSRFSRESGGCPFGLGSLVDDKPVKVTIEMPAVLHGDLIDYAELLARDSGRDMVEPTKLIVPMLERFMATDRGLRQGS